MKVKTYQNALGKTAEKDQGMMRCREGCGGLECRGQRQGSSLRWPQARLQLWPPSWPIKSPSMLSVSLSQETGFERPRWLKLQTLNRHHSRHNTPRVPSTTPSTTSACTGGGAVRVLRPRKRMLPP